MIASQLIEGGIAKAKILNDHTTPWNLPKIAEQMLV
jgi:hypothetical protein